MTAGGCAEVRLSLGAYVLGALDPAERGRVDVHLTTCDACRDELASFAAMPGLLGRVSVAEVELVPDPPRPELLGRLLEAVAQERRRSRRMGRLAATAAGVIVLAAASVAGLAVSSSSGGNGGGGGSEAATTFTATNPQTHVTASVVEWPKAWGAALQVNLTGVSTGGYGQHLDRCQLVAVTADGATEIAASWSPTASDKIVAQGATGFAASDIARFNIVGSDGATLVSIPAHQASGGPSP